MHTARRLRLTWLDAILVAASRCSSVTRRTASRATLTYRWDWSAHPTLSAALGRRDAILDQQPAAGWPADNDPPDDLGQPDRGPDRHRHGPLPRVRRLFCRAISEGSTSTWYGTCRRSSSCSSSTTSSAARSSLGSGSIRSPKMRRPTSLHLLQIAFGDSNQLSDFLAGVIALALFEGAYVTEIIRAGIQAVERGQSEASLALGLSGRQTLQSIVLAGLQEGRTPR